MLHTQPRYFVEKFLEQICTTKFPAAKLREGRMIWYRLVQINAEESSERNIYLNLLLQFPLRINAV